MNKMTSNMSRNDEIIKLAKDIKAGKVFGTWNLREHDAHLIPMIFMPVALSGAELMKEIREKEYSHIYEYVDQAGPRAINGFPCFWSCAFLNKNDWQSICRTLAKLDEIENRVNDELLNAADDTPLFDPDPSP